MNFFLWLNSHRWQIAWWLCVVTVPWGDKINNASLIFLAVTWLFDSGLSKKWEQLKTARWVWPFFVYYGLLVVGLIYTHDLANGFFTLEKKISFIALPLIAATGRTLDNDFIGFLKRCFVYSCFIVVAICVGAAIFHLFYDTIVPANFDALGDAQFRALHPFASVAWSHFSYIQLAQWMGLHPAYFSMYLVFCLSVLFIEESKSNKDRVVNIFIASVMVAGLAFLASRMAILAFICICIYLGWRKTQELRMIPLTPIIAVVCICFLLWLNPVARFRVIEEPATTTYRADSKVTDWNSVSYRLLEWKGSWSIIREKILFGTGTGGSAMAMNDFYDHYSKSTQGLGYNVHNQYLQTWTESGFLGLVVFLLCLWLPLFRVPVDRSYIAFILTFSLMCLTESVVERQKGIVFFTLFQSLFLGFKKY